MAEGSGLLNRQSCQVLTGSNPVLSAILVCFEVLYEKKMYLFEN